MNQLNNKQALVQVKATKLGDMTFSKYMSTDLIKRKIIDVIGGEKGQRFITSIVSAVSNNSSLSECDNNSIFTAALLGETLNLSPSPQLGQYYLVPYNDKKKGKVAQFQLGYKGYQQLAIRSGQLKKLNVLEIKEGELISYSPLEEEIEVKLIENESEREKAKTIGYYAMFELLNGYKKTMYWSFEKMLNHADTYSKAFSATSYKALLEGKINEKDMWKYSSFWYKNFDDMAKKTMLRQLISKGGCPMSIDMQKAYISDMAVIKDDGSYEYVDNNEDVNNEVNEAQYQEVNKEENDKIEEVLEENAQDSEKTVQNDDVPEGQMTIKEVDISEL